MQRRFRVWIELPPRHSCGAASSISTETPASRAVSAAHSAALPPPITSTSVIAGLYVCRAALAPPDFGNSRSRSVKAHPSIALDAVVADRLAVARELLLHDTVHLLGRGAFRIQPERGVALLELAIAERLHRLALQALDDLARRALGCGEREPGGEVEAV